MGRRDGRGGGCIGCWYDWFWVFVLNVRKQRWSRIDIYPEYRTWIPDGVYLSVVRELLWP